MLFLDGFVFTAAYDLPVTSFPVDARLRRFEVGTPVGGRSSIMDRNN